MRRLGSAGLLLVCACGPDVAEPAQLGEVCGREAPVQILELGPDVPLAKASELAHIDGRRLVRIRFRDEGTESGFGGLPAADGELWSVGECGEAPVKLPNGARLKRFDAWPDMLFSCDDDAGEISTVDPYGMRPPNVVFRASEPCDGTETPAGLVVVEAASEEIGSVVLLPWVDDPWTQTAVPEPLLDPIRIRAVPSHTGPEFSEVVDIVDDAVFAIEPDNDLVRLSLVDRTVSVEATGVREFDLSRDGRYVVWQDVQWTNDDEDWPSGAVFLLERDTGQTRYLADVALAGTWFSSLDFIDDGVVWLQLGYLDQQPARYWRLPDLTSVDLPLGRQVAYPIEDGRWLVGSSFFDGPYELYEPDLSAGRSLFPHDGSPALSPRDGGIEIIQDYECCISDEYGRTEGTLWFVPWDGDAQKLANRVTSVYGTLADDRVVTTLDVDDELLGTLMAIDPADRRERIVDENVLSTSVRVEDDDTILYGVSDGDRTGVWLTKLAP